MIWVKRVSERWRKKQIKVVRHHHERYNGTGYPDGLSGKQIPLGARILAVADSYDAMTSEHPYRKAMSAETAFIEIERCRDTQFDPEIVDAYLRVKKPQSFYVTASRTK